MLLRILAAKNLAGVPLTIQYINHEGKWEFFFRTKAKAEVMSHILTFNFNTVLLIKLECAIQQSALLFFLLGVE